MKNRLPFIVNLLSAAVILLASCTPAAAPTPAASQPPAAPPAAATQPAGTEAQPTAAPVQPAATLAPTAAPKSNRLGGWLDKIIFSAIPDAEPAVAQIQAGTIDMYSATIDKADVLSKIKADPKLTSTFNYGSDNSILFNPVMCTDPNILNPFNNMKIREAMNWAVDRNYVVQEIFGGLARPKYTAFSTVFPDYSRYADLFSAMETKYAYDLNKAQAVVDAEMPTMGASKGPDGTWQFKGKPVTIIGLIRTEDQRKVVGEYFANQLEKLGFKVDRQEKTRTEAAPIWQTDPAPCKFNFYTAGWIGPQIYRDEGLNFIQFNTGQLQGLPLFDAFHPSKELLDASNKLYTNTFNSMDERRKLFETALPLAMQEAWWGLWINDNASFEAYSSKVQAASDLAGGFAGSQIFPYTLRLAGQEGGTVRIANSAILVNPWNPIGGSNFIDDSIVRNTTVDYGVAFDPYTGLVVPKLVTKAEVDIVKGLPVAPPMSDWVTLKTVDQINVPDDAWVDWDAAKQVFITAAEKAKADPTWKQTAKTKSVVVYTPDLWKTTWHDGSNLAPSDFVFYLIMSFDLGKKESKIYDDSYATAVETILTHFKGAKITSTDPMTVEVYDDSYALDAENNVRDFYPQQNPDTAYGGGMYAWQALTPGIQAEADGKMAFSQDKSSANKVDWTSQISGPTLAVQAQYLDKDIADKYIPYAPTLGKYITPEQAAARYANLKAFYTAHNNMVLGTGPYFIDQVFPVEGTVTVSRYDKYLFPADQLSGFGEPKMMTTTVDGPVTVAAGEEASFDVTVDFKDQPYPAADIDAVSYLLFNVNGDLVSTGTAAPGSEGKYTVTLGKDVTAKLDAGTAKLTVTSTSKVVSLPEIVSTQFVVTK